MSDRAMQSTATTSDARSPEQKILLLCARPCLDDAARVELNHLLSSKLDWDSLIAAAQRHALLPLMHHHLSKCKTDLVPPAHAKQLRIVFQENVARNLVLMDELRSITYSFQSDGVESFPFKGPVLGLLAYDDPGLRQSADLDIVVHPTDVGKAWQCLKQRGYRLTRKVDGRQTQFLISRQHNIQFARDEGRLLVELHWRIAPKLFALGFGAEDLWSRLKSINVKGVELRALPVEELLMTLCVHGARHLWERLSWVTDLAAVISTNDEICWTELLAMAKRTQTERILLVGLQLAKELLSTPLPPEISKAIADDAMVAMMVKKLTNRICLPEANHSFRQTFKCQLQMRKGWSARLRYCRFAMSPTDGELEMMSVPAGFNFLYYALRPWRLLSTRGSWQAGQNL
jgi:putative nucleotidyltransferase-like protein